MTGGRPQRRVPPGLAGATGMGPNRCHATRRRHDSKGTPQRLWKWELTMNWKDCSAVESRKDKLGGAWVFRGTRVPVAALFENLLGEAKIHQFTEWFPGVESSQVQAAIQHQISTSEVDPVDEPDI